MDDVKDSYPPGTVVFWSLSTNSETGEAQIHWYKKGDSDFEKVNVPGGVQTTWGCAHDGSYVAFMCSTPNNPLRFNVIGPFGSEEQAQLFAGRISKMLNDPYQWIGEKWDATGGHRTVDPPVTHNVTLDEATTAARSAYDTVEITKGVHAELLADAERYRRLAAGNDVDGKRLLTVAMARRLQRAEDALREILVTVANTDLGGIVTGAQIDFDGFTLKVD